MSLVTSIQSHRKAIIGASIALIVLGIYAATQKPMQKVVPFEKGGIPIPFLEQQEGGSLKGAVTFYDKRNNIDVYEVTFTAGETSENLGENLIYLVHIPNDTTITERDFDGIMRQRTGGRAVNYYGYKYTDALATTERLNINNADFKQRFPGEFFASAKARAEDATHGNGIQRFETERGISFRQTNGNLPKSTLTKNALYVLIVNEAGANSAKIYPKGAPALCGDGAVEGVEICDDGNQVDTDACKNNCTANTGGNPICGNGIKEGSEACDDGNSVNTDSCSNTCTVNTPDPVCGNGTREGTEQCDDGNSVNTDACKNDCTSNTGNTPVCGNGVKEGTEVCDDGDQNNNNLCRTDCTAGLPVPFTTEPTNTPPTTCGDRVIQTGEQCDNGSQTTGGQNGVRCATNGCTYCSLTCQTMHVDILPTSSSRSSVASSSTPPQPSEDVILTTLAVPTTKGVIFPQATNQPVETFVKFSLTARAGISPTVKKLEFTAGQGSIPMAYDYELWKDTNNDGTVDQKINIAPTSEETPILSFSINNQISLSTTPVVFELRGLPQATGLLQLVPKGMNSADHSVQAEGCGSSACTIGEYTEHQPTVFAFSSHGAAPSPYALTIEQIATSVSAMNANNRTTVLSFRAIAHIYDESDVALKTLKFKVVSGVPTDARYELWYDSDNNGTPETPWSILGVVDPQTKIVTFETENGTVPGYLMDGRRQHYDVRVIHDPVIASNNTEFKMTFAITDPAYVRAVRVIDGDFSNPLNISGIRTNTICSGTCAIDVTEVPSTILSLFTTTNVIPLCGNAYKEGNEQCDNDIPSTATSLPNGGDGCSRTCTIEQDYTCTGTHPSVCTPNDNPLCGNGIINRDVDEECDDGDKDNGDGCSAACTVEAPHYSCDGPFNGPSVCHLCGDGVINFATEECDDANQVSGDGCSNACAAEPSFSCEENAQGVSVCYRCGDKDLNEDIEECDDGDSDNGDGCSNECIVEDGYVCSAVVDQATGKPYSVCSGGSGGGSGNTGSLCGNGTINTGETCDQGSNNVTNGDGCSATCTTEANFRCTGTPSTCISYLNFVKNLADTNRDGTVDSDTEGFGFVLAIFAITAQDNPVIDIKYDINGDGTANMTDIALISPLMNSL